MLGELRVQDPEVALRFVRIAVDRVRQVGRIVFEVHRLAGIRANSCCHEHEPGQHRAARCRRVFRQELTGLFGEVQQDRVAVENRHTVIDDGRRLCIRVDGQIFGFELLALARVDWDQLVG